VWVISWPKQQFTVAVAVRFPRPGQLDYAGCGLNYLKTYLHSPRPFGHGHGPSCRPVRGVKGHVAPLLRVWFCASKF